MGSSSNPILELPSKKDSITSRRHRVHVPIPMAQFAYNNAPYSSSNVSPFFANYGYNPQCNFGSLSGNKVELASSQAVALKESTKKSKCP
ncbi:hypothetical protein DSO57_1004835 [Entomophthora muscae]|uniref:Uncharacterized protein n=1 Tax=Entomophthora muscae TaxID=34485 RepID=A0ACC2S9Z7_9FUNG|nr:hypothetical protein DSO57_1004835 [Entomophthora muscae]